MEGREEGCYERKDGRIFRKEGRTEGRILRKEGKKGGSCRTRSYVLIYRTAFVFTFRIYLTKFVPTVLISFLLS